MPHYNSNNQTCRSDIFGSSRWTITINRGPTKQIKYMYDFSFKSLINIMHYVIFGTGYWNWLPTTFKHRCLHQKNVNELANGCCRKKNGTSSPEDLWRINPRASEDVRSTYLFVWVVVEYVEHRWSRWRCPPYFVSPVGGCSGGSNNTGDALPGTGLHGVSRRTVEGWWSC